MMEKLTEVFREVFDDDEITPHPQMTAAEVPEWDSLNHIRLMVAVEQAFNIHFTTNEISNLKNVGELMDLINSKLR